MCNQNKSLTWMMGLIAGALLGSAPAPAPAGPVMLVCSFFGDRVARFDLATGQFLGNLQAGVGLDGPLSARLGPDGLIYVASEGTDRIQRYHPDSGAFIDNFVPAGSGGLNEPTGVTWGPDGNLYVPSFINDMVRKYDGSTGAHLGAFVQPASGGLDGPDNGTIFGPDGDLYVPSYWNNRILRYDGDTGFPLGAFVPSISRPRVLEFRGDRLYVTSETADAVRMYNISNGAFLGNFTAPGAGGMDQPIGMAFGPDGFLYVSSGTRDNVLRFNAQTGAFVDVFIPTGLGGIDAPTFVTIIPEPASLILLAAGALLMLKRRRAAQPA